VGEDWLWVFAFVVIATRSWLGRRKRGDCDKILSDSSGLA